MKVVTSNPLIVDGRKVNKPSEYLSFDGTNPREIRAFQDWMDLTRPGWYRGGNMNKGKRYGEMDRPTRVANRKFGAQFDAAVTQSRSRSTQGTFMGTVNATTGEFTPPTNQYSNTSPRGERRKGQFWDKARGGWVKAQTAFDRANQVMQNLRNIFGDGRGQQQWDDQGWNQGANVQWDQQQQWTPQPEPRMNRGLKIGLIVGGVALGVVAIVAGVRYYKKGKAKKAS